MDKLACSAYADPMFKHFVAMFAILAVLVVSTVTSAHAARMSVAPDHAVDDGQIRIVMIHAPGSGGHSCDGEPQCESRDSGLCEFVCAGLSAFITSPFGEAGHIYGPANHDQPTAAILVSRMPSLSERPPKLRLL